MARDSISTSIKRELWAQCGGYCQNPNCNNYLFANIESDVVTLANVAHIIGLGKGSPRSEPKLAKLIQKDGYSNLIMLCLDCHKIVDELEAKYPVEVIRLWKANHINRIKALFAVPIFDTEKELLKEVNDLLDINKSIFETYGPFSKLAIQGEGGDAQIVWKRRCLDTILPNNQRIIDIFENNKRRNGYPWEAYRKMLEYKTHADSFRENCVIDERVNDYKLFPPEFDYYIKTKLGIQTNQPELREKEELDFRYKTISDYINRFLANHKFIASMKQWNIYIFELNLIDGRLLRAFVTNTYYFTEYTFEKIIAIDPNIDAIICSSPYSTYSLGAKRRCIESEVGLFMLGEFMGALAFEGEKFLNYLLKAERKERIKYISDELRESDILGGKGSIYLMGSYLRRKVFNDIDILFVYEKDISASEVDSSIAEIVAIFDGLEEKVDITVCSQQEFLHLTLDHDNTVKVL